MYAITGWSVILMFLNGGSAVFCAFVATQKHRWGLAWFFLGLLFGIPALLGIVGCPALAPQPEGVSL